MIVVLCGVCKLHLRYYLDGKNEIRESHGLCPECYAARERELDQMEQMLKEQRDADGNKKLGDAAGQDGGRRS